MKFIEKDDGTLINLNKIVKIEKKEYNKIKIYFDYGNEIIKTRNNIKEAISTRIINL